MSDESRHVASGILCHQRVEEPELATSMLLVNGFFVALVRLRAESRYGQARSVYGLTLETLWSSDHIMTIMTPLR